MNVVYVIFTGNKKIINKIDDNDSNIINRKDVQDVHYVQVLDLHSTSKSLHSSGKEAK